MDNVPLTDLFIVTDVSIFGKMMDGIVGASTWLLKVFKSMYICMVQSPSDIPSLYMN